MKKSLKKALFSSIFLISLASCGTAGSTPAEPEEEVIVLDNDTNANYVLDPTSTNENGSMSYEIFVRSFYDTNNDGIGDFNGVTAKLDYLKSMGIKTLWLMPIMPSPTYHGYDVKNYFDVNSDFGTMSDFDNLVRKANEHGIDIMIDMVFNHSSTQNPYFNQSYLDYVNNYTGADSLKDWYNWSTTSKPSYSKYNNLYYESRFDSSMPDFNLDSTTLRAEIDKICKFWIQDHGVKAFRLDAVLYYYGGVTQNVEFLDYLKATGKKYNPDFYMVGEQRSAASSVLQYYASQCDSFFNFDSSITGDFKKSILAVSKQTNNAKAFATQIASYEKKLKEKNPYGYSSYFLSNHDQDRSSNTLRGDPQKVAASILGLMPGTPYMYYGEEISLVGVRQTGGHDDGSDVKRRLPMVWSENNKTGECDFPEKNRQDLNTTEQVKKGVEDQLSTNYSLINHYKKVINVRNKIPFIKDAVFTSEFDNLETENTAVLAYKLAKGTEEVYVITNTDTKPVKVKALGSTIFDSINTAKKLPKVQDGYLYLGEYSTVILKK